ncbi:Myosin and Kinesin Tail domain protein [Blomia tropicalis]|nr:Myosin and Kinesin Tail domain protein [Blomia tropicalis]
MNEVTNSFDDPVWFEPDDHEVVTYIPGIVTNYSPSTQLVTIESSAIDGNIQVFHVANTNVRHRRDFIEANVDNTDDVDGVGHLDIDDMICLRDINKSALFWNLKKRYERNKIYTFIGNILVSMNPYKMFEIYGLNTVKKYQNQLRSALPPHLFAIGNLAYNKMLKDQENQCIMIMGESGSGKTENTKLLLQYFAAINKSSSNIITEQILESIPLLESFGNSKTTRNNNASRYCKYIEVFFNNGVIAGAKTMEFLHEKSRIVSHNQEERNFHIFYELLDGLGETEKEKYGLQVAEKYFYLNQGNCCQIDGKDDAEDFRFLIGAMQVLGFTMEEQDIIFRILASILHLGNVYFHRKQYRHGQEGVEIGSDAEIRWVSHLLQIPIEDIFRLITTRTTETRQERLITPLNIDQALDMRDAFSKVLYVSLFGWLVQRINHIVYNKSLANSTSYSNNNSTTSSSARKQNKIALLDMFGFENLKENNFEQLCINYANELMYHHYTKCVFRNEQSEYMKEKVEWTEVAYPDNQPILNLISKKPIGLLPLLEDESNFPKANDNSYLEKCHYNHALNVIYSRARMTAVEFGIKHFEGQVWYTVEGFLEKNRDILRTDVIDTMLTSKMPIMHKIFGHARETTDYGRPSHINNRTVDGRFVTIKPRAPTVSARFQESLTTLFDGASATNPWFIRCIRPNNERKAMQFDDRIVFDQIHNSSLLETITVRSRGYPIRMRYAQFVSRYHSFLTSQLPRGTPSKEVSRLIVEKKLSHLSSDDYKFGFSKIFLKESAEILLEHDRHENMVKAAITIQAFIRGYLTRRRYRRVRRGIIRIQRTFRGYRQRKNYQTLRRGIVRLQATYRMQRQKQEYERIKTVREKREAERYIMEKSKELSTAMVNGLNGSTANLKQSTTPTINNDSPRVQSSASSNNGVASIDFPNELTNLLSEMDGWKCSHAYNDIIKMVKTVIPLRQRYQSLPFDIDHHSFAKFTNIYFRSQQWGARRDPIKSPFLQKNSDSDVQESLLIFRLILRFMNDNQLSGKKEKLLADYIVQKGLKNIALRDEILCQLCNQTWKNDSQESADNGWTLMIHCLSSFAPSQLLYKYLLKYVSDHSPNPFRPILQRLLLSSDKDEPANSRSFPASLLEWKANLKRCGMSVDLQCPNGDFKLVQLDSWTTGEQLTSDLLHSCGFNQNSNLFGWSVDFDDDGDLYTVNGDDYILDMVSQMELPPSFPASNHHSYIGRKNPYRTAHSSINPFHDPDRLNKINIDHLLSNGGTKRNEPSHVFLKSNVVQRQLNQKMRSLSGETLMRVDGDDGSLGLAVNSKLNERYLLKNHATSLQTFNQLIEADEDENMDVDVDVVVADDRSDNDTELKLSEKSRLNQRYISTNKANELGGKRLHNESRSNRKNLYTRKSDKQSNNKLNNQRSMSMQELGLASSSSLNIRYFSRDKLNKTASLTGGSDNDSDSLNKVQSLMNFGNEQVSSSSLASSPNSDTKQTKPIKPYGRTSSKTNLMARPLPAEPEPIDEYNRIPGVIHRSSEFNERSKENDFAIKSSAMSDTSEAPSLASHPSSSSSRMNNIDPNLSNSQIQLNIAGLNVNGPIDSNLLQQQVIQQQMYQMQQRAFLASSLQQNLEIQKQLLQQNQQLQHLLAQAVSPAATSAPSSLTTIETSPIVRGVTQTPVKASDSKVENPTPKSKISIVSPNPSSNGIIKMIPPPPPPPPPPLSPGTDVFGRAKTVRIGKWRWPPPSEENGGIGGNNFIEFKRKKQIEKQQDGNSPPLKHLDSPSEQQNHSPNSSNDNEMRAKLEQLTIDQSVRSTKRDRKDPGSNGSGANGSIVVSSQSMDDIANMSSVKKLSEQRKALLERQLMGSLVRNVTTFMETTSTPNIKQSVDIISDHHRKLSKENSSNSNYEPSSHVKKFIKNQQNILRKSGSREFRERREELGPFNRLSASSVHVNYQTDSRPLYTPDRYFQKDGDQSNSVAAGLQFDQDSQSAESSGNGRHSSSSGRFYGNGAFNRSKRMNNPPPPPPMDTASLNGINNHQSVLANKNRHLPLSRSQDRLAFDISDHHHHNHHYGDSRSIMKGFASEFHNGGINIEQKQMKTKLFYKNELNYYAYSKPKFKLNLRKELFSPTETIENPILLDLIFWQIVSDVYTGACIRLNNEQTQSLQCRLKAEGIHGYNPSGYSPKTPFKRSLIDAVKELPTYFSRLYVVSGGKTMPNVDCIGVSHSGVHLLHLERNDGPNNKRDPELIVLEKLNYDDISEILIPSNCTLQILFNGGEWITLYSNKSRQIRNLIEKFVVEHQQSNVEYVRTIKDYVSNEPSVLSFKKDSIIRVVKNRHLHLAKGWSFGVLEFGESGLFQSINVIPLTAQQVQSYQRQMDDETLRNSNHHPHNHSHHQQATPNGNGFNHHHSHHTTTKDETQLENGIAINGGNGSPQDYNSIWIESRTDTIGDDDVKLDLNQLGADNNNSASLSTYGDGNFSLLQFALFNFRESLNKYDLRGHMKDNNSIRGSIKMIENLKSKKKSKSKGDSNDWTWSEFANLVKYSKTLIQSSLLMLSPELNKVAVECFSAIMRYMGDLAMVKNQNEVDCVYTILVNCHKHAPIRDEIYCQLMKQTTSNKSARLDSCQRGWRLFSIVAAYFDCSDTLQPYLFKYLETAAYDKRRAFHVTATIALTNLKKTFKYGGRKNVPSIEEIAAISAGRTSKRQMYRLPGGTERILNTTCTTVVNDIIEEICLMLNVTNGLEMEEFSLYCIIEGDPFTMPLNRDEYILDVTTELLKNGQLFYLIFCRSVWYHPLRLDSHLYIEVVFNQVAPDYLEGLLIIIQHEKLSDDCAQQIARIASLLHRAAEMDQMPSKDEIKYLLPKPVLAMRTIKPHQWVEMVQNHWNDMSALSTIEAKAQCLDILQKWPLFGSCFFAVKRIQNDSHTHPDHILALNKDGVHFLDMVTHEKVWKHPFSEVISTRKVRSEDGTLYLDMKCGNLMVQKITRIQTDQAHEISRLIRQYIEIEQHLKSGRNSQNDDSNISNISISNGINKPLNYYCDNKIQ